VVLDTNVLVAAILSADGAPAHIVGGLSEGLFDAVTCPRLVGELSGVLSRPKIRRHVSRRDAAEYTSWLVRVSLPFPDPDAPPAICSDPADDFVIALATESDSHVVVSGDAHLTSLSLDAPRVLSPSSFAAILDELR